MLLNLQHLVGEVKKTYLSHGQEALKTISEIFIQWQEIRQQLLMLNQDVFGRNMDDIEDQLDLMSLADFAYTRQIDILAGISAISESGTVASGPITE